jgi:hypothetical protein
MSSASESFQGYFDSHEPKALNSPFLNEEYLVEEARTAQVWRTSMPEFQLESPFLEAFEEEWRTIRESEFEFDQEEWEKEAITDYTPAEEGQLPTGQPHKFLTDSRELLIHLTRLVFFARHPELEQPGGTGCRCNPKQRTDHQLTEAQKQELVDIRNNIVQPALTQGTDENQLTNLVFCARHPELPDCKIPEHDETLRKEWTCIRNSCIRPPLTKTFNQWLQTVDKTVRKQFGLTGVGLAGHVKFLTQTQFAKQLLAADIPELLLKLFLNPSQPTVIIRAILRFHHQADLLEGMRDEKRMQERVRKLRKFIAERIKIGNFQSAVAPPVNPKKIKTLPSSPGGTVTITPAELVTIFTSGLTKIAATRSGRTILMQMHSEVEVLVHEACHFYMHNQFKMAAEKASNRFFNGLRLSEILLEGFPEHFTRQVMQANENKLGRLHVEVYQDYVEAAGRFITTIEDKAKGSARKAFFEGNSAAINLLFRAIELNIKNYPLLVPGFMLEQQESNEVDDELDEAKFFTEAEELKAEEFHGFLNEQGQEEFDNELDWQDQEEFDNEAESDDFEWDRNIGETEFQESLDELDEEEFEQIAGSLSLEIAITPKALKLVDHFYIHKSLPDGRVTGLKRLVPQDMNPGFISLVTGDLLVDRRADGLQTRLDTLIRNNYAEFLASRSSTQSSAKAGDKIRVALVDLTGQKLFEPDFAGWGATVATEGASVPKICALYAVHQLRQDLNHLAKKLPRKADLIKVTNTIWRNANFSSQPKLEALFKFPQDNSNPFHVEFSDNLVETLKTIFANNSNCAATRLILQLGFNYIASVLWQSGLRHPTRGGLWLRGGYCCANKTVKDWLQPDTKVIECSNKKELSVIWGKNSVWQPKEVFRHNVTALSLAAFYTLLAQGRLIDDQSSQDMKELLEEGCSFDFRNTLNGLGGLSSSPGKCGVHNQHLHESMLVKRDKYCYVAVALTINARDFLFDNLIKLIKDLDKLIQDKNP